ncbi:response regulator transcription factor [Nannocystis sp.]|uniref:response regulator transcription factor n=1 Tax=Nannocystis sp. TaxID=1962667 RepID=UPI002421862E|nr:response regulator transcription factor [Nannocystis sp.]MBK7826161.1 response regulator transcription factor [Nannocystis sp.]MBK9757234.1 response regulator transcription factor [Nannocystis sp.]
MRILAVEDDERLVVLLQRGLREEGHVVDACSCCADALGQAQTIAYDVILLDWMLPDGDGLSLLRSWRDRGVATPVLMLTARGAVGERVLGLRSGADDYLVKPFDFAELLARIEVLGRRRGGEAAQLRAGAVLLDGRKRALIHGAQEVALTAREFALCSLLFRRVGEVLTRSELLAGVWGPSFDGEPNVLDVYIGYLRGKLAELGEEAPTIRAQRGVGFRLQLAEVRR